MPTTSISTPWIASSASSDFFTLDVADTIGQPARAGERGRFLERHPELMGAIDIPGIEQPFTMSPRARAESPRKYLRPCRRPAASIATSRSRKPRWRVHHRSFDGRDRSAADAARVAADPGRHLPTSGFPSRPSRRSSPAGSTKASITSATSRSSNRNSQPISPSSHCAVRSTACRRI